MPKSTREKVLGYIQSHLQERQIPPTLRDIQVHFGFSAIGTVQYHLKQLSQEGYVEIQPRLSRGITLTSKTLGIPILGRVPAGPAQLAFEEVESYLPTSALAAPAPSSAPPSPADTRGLYALRIKGDSMIEAGILDKDLVIIRPQASAKSGDIVVARIGDDEATVKRLVRKPGILQLAPANPKYRPIPIDENVKIIGKVIRVVRQYN
ncbi:MAG: repressor LexA [Elusimicrobia bacterium RIFCSPLOWO2_01_FULL_59_12]|nr:MAG: repressor LexA [Elusimicrobia bacterium RIFCSPLOWO2_01_FULL_59_12]